MKILKKSIQDKIHFRSKQPKIDVHLSNKSLSTLIGLFGRAIDIIFLQKIQQN
jgi:hypothetical protein